MIWFWFSSSALKNTFYNSVHDNEATSVCLWPGLGLGRGMKKSDVRAHF